MRPSWSETKVMEQIRQKLYPLTVDLNINEFFKNECYYCSNTFILKKKFSQFGSFYLS